MYKDYFKEIFETNKTVIIPGLGAFTKNNEIITFNPYLKFNDGFLAGFIAKKQGISIEAAGNLISENVEKINQALSAKGEAMVLGLGIIKKSGEGKFDFIKNESLDNDAPPPPVVEKQELKVEVKPVVETKEEIKPVVTPPVENKKPEEKIIPSEEKKINIPVPELKNIEPAANINTPKEKAKKVKEKKEKLPREKKKGKIPYVLISIILLLGGAGVFTILKWDMVKGWIGLDKKETAAIEKPIEMEEKTIATDTAATINDTTTVVEDTVVNSSEAITETPVETEKTEPVKIVEEVKSTPVVTGNFHVIVGCFSVKQNADNMVNKLNSEGHQGVNLGLRGSFYMVSAGSFSTNEEAKSKLEAIKATYAKAYLYNGQ